LKCWSVFNRETRITRFVTRVTVLQCVAVCCSVLKCICQKKARIPGFVTSHCVAVYCSLLQCVEVCLPQRHETLDSSHQSLLPSEYHELYQLYWMRDLEYHQLYSPNIADFITSILEISQTLLPKLDERSECHTNHFPSEYRQVYHP